RRGPFLTRTTKRRLGSSRATSLDVCNRSSGGEVRRVRGFTYTPETDFSEHRVRSPPISQGIGLDSWPRARRPDWNFVCRPAAVLGPHRTAAARKPTKCCIFNELARRLLLHEHNPEGGM